MTADPLHVTRPLALSAPATDIAVARLAGGQGVLSVSSSRNGARLIVTYDVRQTGMAALARLAVTVGLAPSNRLWARLARGWAAFQDENLRNQAKIVRRCCGGFTPPERD
jgi:hypothetical protein